MKVMLISPYPLSHSGGVETFVRSLGEGLRDRGIEVDIVTLSEKQLKLIPKQSKILINLALKKNIEKKELKGSILHFNAWTSYLAKYFSNPTVVTSHGTIINMLNNSAKGFSFFRRVYLNRITASLERKGFNYCDKVIATCNQVKEEMINDYHIPENKIEIIYIGVKIEKPKKKLRYELGYSDEDVILLTSGRGDYNKGMDLMYKIAKKMNKKYGIKFLAAGRSIIKPNNNWFKVVEFPPHLMPSVYSLADIYLHASRYESYGLSLLEAMAQRLPPVAFNVGVAGDAIINNENGFLIKRGDVNSFENKVEYLILNKKDRKRMGDKALTTISKKFNFDNMIKEYIKLYNSLL